MKKICRKVFPMPTGREESLAGLNDLSGSRFMGYWKGAVDRAARYGVDAMIVADPGLMRYACDHHPDLRLHLSVQGSATNYDAINFYARHFRIAESCCRVFFRLNRLNWWSKIQMSKSRCSDSAVCVSWWRDDVPCLPM